ncbi:hypothetical protein HPB47_012498 [Ixodes persulcatus]|uniref:Uncharacterized protein n=1 Tax=Ixodes persulcatus TaxID=34615 RepID=A0AC60NTC9_IXOPE|nr:hypothetical protein HPB47_012498 [Ixodes persulcatus]
MSEHDVAAPGPASPKSTVPAMKDGHSKICTLVCIASEHVRSKVPLSLCDYFIGTTVTYINDTITEANSYRKPFVIWYFLTPQ